MRGTKAEAAANRHRVLAEAARRFRERGFDGIGVAELMGGVGLTHGGFYSHFTSKEQLAALACRHAVDEMLANWTAKAEAAPEDPLAAICGAYLSAEHRDSPGTGCLMAALGPEAARQAPQVRAEVTACFRDVLDHLAGCMPGTSASERRRQAIRMFASLVGAMVSARAIDDSVLSEEILVAVRQTVARRGR